MLRALPLLSLCGRLGRLSLLRDRNFPEDARAVQLARDLEPFRMLPILKGRLEELECLLPVGILDARVACVLCVCVGRLVSNARGSDTVFVRLLVSPGRAHRAPGSRTT